MDDVTIRILAQDLAGPVLDSLRGDLDVVGTQANTTAGHFDSFSAKITSLGETAQRVGSIMSVGLTTPLTLLGKGAIDAASDMNESASKSMVVFGEWNGVITTFAKDAARNLGMSAQAATESAGTFGNLFTAMGFGQGEAAKMSTGILQLAADLASFNNMDPAEVLEKLRAGLVGETEPLRTLGVNLNAASIEAKAMELGLAATTKELTVADKTTAAYALIMEQTKTAQGDFARTADGLANSQRIAKAEMADLSAELGTVLLPFMKDAVGVVRNVLAAFSDLSPEMQTVVVAGGAILAGLGPLVGIFGTILTVVGALTPVFVGLAGAITATALPALGALVVALSPILIPIAAVAAAVGALYLAYSTNFLGIRDIVDSAVAVILPVLRSVASFLEGTFHAAVASVTSVFQGLLSGVQTASNWIDAHVLPVFRALSSVFDAIANVTGRALAGLMQNIISPTVSATVSNLTGQFEELRSALALVAMFVSNVYQPIWDRLSDVFRNTLLPVLRDVGDFIGGVLNSALAILYNTYISPLVSAFGSLGGVIDDVSIFLSAMADAINSITLPWFLTPGSPTPFETGLTGVLDVLGKLAAIANPFSWLAEVARFWPSLFGGGPPGGSGGGSGGTGGGSQIVVNGPLVQINGSVTAEDAQDIAGYVRTAFEMLAAAGPEPTTGGGGSW